MWFLKFLLFIVIIYIVGYLFFRFALPWILKRFVRRIAKKMNVPFEEAPKKKKTGEINIDYVPENNTNENQKNIDGEYVDFEEIK